MISCSRVLGVRQTSNGRRFFGLSVSTSSVSGNDDQAPPLLKEYSSKEDGVLTLTLNCPNQRNALNKRLLEEMHAILHSLHFNTTADVRAVVIQATSSSGNSFCSGHDLRELQSTATHLEKEEHMQMFDLCSQVMQLLQNIPQPTVCAVHGMATAAGCRLVAAADMAIASPSARFSTPGVNIRLFCHTPAVPLVRCIGPKKAMDMLLTGRVLSANQALEYGLISRIVEKIDEEDDDDDEATSVQKEAYALAKSIAGRSACAVGLGKQTFYQQAAETSLDRAYKMASAAMVKNLQTYDASHGIGAFLNKTKPEWKHR
jgi:enoyl-CoA hydratase/carnithine racemase